MYFFCLFAKNILPLHAEMNTIGQILRFTDFGESHGVAVGGVLDGVPSQMKIDFDAIQYDLDRRAGRIGDLAVSARAKEEKDEIEWLSGLLDRVTLGTPIAFIIRNTNARPEDYEYLFLYNNVTECIAKDTLIKSMSRNTVFVTIAEAAELLPVRP